jgi:hypothetical protein
VLLLSPTVSVSAVERASVVLEEVARQGGMRIAIARAVPDHALIVRMKDVPADEALRRVAWAVYAQVETKDGVTWITPDTVAINRARREYRQWRIARNRELVKAVYDRVFYPPKGAEPETSPSKRALARFLNALPADQWADYDPLRPVFATNPTPMQRPLPSGPLREFQAEINAARERLDLAPITVGKVRITLPEGDRPRIAGASMNATKPDGGEAREARNSLGDPSFDFTELLPPPTLPAEILAAVPESTPVEWSEETKTFLNPEPATDGSSPLAAKLRDPLRFDPLRLGVADVYAGLAARTGSSVVVSSSDENLYFLLRSQPATLRQALERIWSPFARVEPGWVMDRPPVARPEWAWQVDRVALARFIADSLSPTADSVEARANYLRAGGLRGAWGLGGPVIFQAVGERALDGLTAAGMHVYAFLPPSVRNGLRRGGRVSVSALPDDARTVLWTRLAWEDLKPPESDRPIFARPMAELFPNGLPDGELTGAERATPYLRVWLPDAKGTPRARVVPATWWGQQGTQKAVRIEPLWHPVIQLRIQFANGWRWEKDVESNDRSAGPAVTELARLPSAHREAIAQGLASRKP